MDLSCVHKSMHIRRSLDGYAYMKQNNGSSIVNTHPPHPPGPEGPSDGAAAQAVPGAGRGQAPVAAGVLPGAGEPAGPAGGALAGPHHPGLQGAAAAGRRAQALEQVRWLAGG